MLAPANPFPLPDSLSGELARVHDVWADPNLVPSQEAALTGKFLGDVELGESFAFLRAQASATVEARAPTYYRIGSRGLSPGFARLLLPLWGDGRIGMLLGAVDRY